MCLPPQHGRATQDDDHMDGMKPARVAGVAERRLID
jgi:hypothetical protein